MTKFLKDLQNKIPLREGIEGYRTIFREIYRASHISLRDLANRTLIPIPVISKVVNFLIEKEILDRISEGILYTEKGMQFIESELKFYGYGLLKCENCQGHPIYITPRWNSSLNMLENLFSQRPQVDTTIDQAFATAQTSLKRALFFYNRGALEGKKICFLGDDDYTSVAVANLYLGFFPTEPKLIPDEMVVVDIDNRILEGIKRAIHQDKFNIKYVSWDYRTVIPENFHNRFDTIVVDPPYSENGLKLVLSRAINILHNNPGGEIFLSFVHRSPKTFLGLQEIIFGMGLAIIEIIPRFNIYEGAAIFGNVTQLIHLVTTNKSKALISTDENFEKPIYTGEISPTLRYYYCIKCNKTIEIGNSAEIKTIEQLKESKCPFCGSTGPFRLDHKIKTSFGN